MGPESAKKRSKSMVFRNDPRLACVLKGLDTLHMEHLLYRSHLLLQCAAYLPLKSPQQYLFPH